MSRLRHQLSLVSAALGLSLALASGCGSSREMTSSGTSEVRAPVGAQAQSCADAVAGVDRLRVAGVSCAIGRGIVAAWDGKETCAAPQDGSRSACAVAGYRCQAVTTPAGLAADCSQPGRSISFQAGRR
jgi:hypothetical protein